MKALLILMTVLMIGSTIPNIYENQINENFGDCDAELSVEKGINSKPTSENGTKFTLTLKNTSLNKTTYTLSAINLQEPCEIKGITSSGNYLALNSYFNLNSSTSHNKITLNGGESYIFMIRLNVPIDASNNDWGCIEIEAKPKNCSSSYIKTIISTYVPN